MSKVIIRRCYSRQYRRHGQGSTRPRTVRRETPDGPPEPIFAQSDRTPWCFGSQIFARSHGSLLKDFPQPDPYGRVGQEPRAALLSGACPPRHAATARPHPAHPSVHVPPPQPASAPRPQPCAHGVGRLTWSGAGMWEPHHSHPSHDGSQIEKPVLRLSLTRTPPSAGLGAFEGKVG